MSSATESMIPATAVEEKISTPTSLEKQPARQHTHAPLPCVRVTDDRRIAPKQLHAPSPLPQAAEPPAADTSIATVDPTPSAGEPAAPKQEGAHTFPRPPPRRTPELRAPERSPARDA